MLISEEVGLGKKYKLTTPEKMYESCVFPENVIPTNKSTLENVGLSNTSKKTLEKVETSVKGKVTGYNL